MNVKWISNVATFFEVLIRIAPTQPIWTSEHLENSLLMISAFEMLTFSLSNAKPFNLTYPFSFKIFNSRNDLYKRCKNREFYFKSLECKIPSEGSLLIEKLRPDISLFTVVLFYLFSEKIFLVVETSISLVSRVPVAQVMMIKKLIGLNIDERKFTEFIAPKFHKSPFCFHIVDLYLISPGRNENWILNSLLFCCDVDAVLYNIASVESLSSCFRRKLLTKI